MRQNMSGAARLAIGLIANPAVPDGANMKFPMIFAGLVACATACRVTPADAGYWSYGCKGSVNEGAILFDRNAFLIMPKALAKGDIAGLTSGEIFTFDAADNTFTAGTTIDHPFSVTLTKWRSIFCQSVRLRSGSCRMRNTGSEWSSQ